MTQTEEEYITAGLSMVDDYLSLLIEKKNLYDRLFKHYNENHPGSLAEFILNDEYYSGKSKGDDEE